MSLHHDHAEPSPKAPLLVIAAIAALSLALAASASFGLVERDAVPNVSRAAAGTQANAIRSLTFADAPDGAVLIDDGTTGERIVRVEPGTGGFIRSTVRSLVHIRRSQGISARTPFTLTRWDDGSLTLSDPTTGRALELGGFGDDNRAVFAALLPEEAA
ncbi:photosynthetic complex assembly protein [Alteriqipengyuania sp. NZ-12B]|uniref:Photosynthetic complex assembly protein n=1 Tax=Alteriqipengyuania abyssalis TaxID=2860200 RepID=A0ABS7PFC9_9SPHN|nr:photosynthetic complex assembly protein PuhC [Alteriqipengyuania abyssalis]MBY8337787.1 photosynthetic complex assembly protein [Alteriqipengyuania abyssalis]